MAATTVVVKSYLEMPDLSVETRRFVVQRAAIDEDGIYGQIHEKVGQIFPDLKGKKFVLFWKDEDDDFVTMSTDDEIRGLLTNGADGTCKIYIKVNGDADERNEAANQGGSNGKDTTLKPEESDSIMAQISSHIPPPPPPPPPFFGFHPPKTFGFHSNFGPHGWHGHHQHQFGFGPHRGFGHRHGFGHHFPHPGMHHGRHHPKHMGGWHHHHQHHHDHHGHHGHHHWGHHWGMQDFKALRAMVPMPHRRWAKGYIQSWRQENLKNATTTTSDSDGTFDWKISMADANVPQAYAGWLDIKLLRWHKNWSSDEFGDMDREDKAEKMEKKARKALKASVPIEFRKWTKRFLNTHFGRRDAPKLRKHPHGCGWNGEEWTNKGAFFAAVPRQYRMWTKKFIRNWRIEKKLDGLNAAIPSSSDTDDGKSDVDSAEEFVVVAPEYKQWLEKFLMRWHVWRGLLERSPDMQMRGGMGCFKGLVPMEYRAWVKFYLAAHYNKNVKKPERSEVESDPSQKKYEVMLQAFQKKWVEEKQKDLTSDSDYLNMSSSEEEETNKGEPENSFERLSISSENGSKKSKVRFDDQSESQTKKQKKMKKTEDDFLLLDSDALDDDDEDTMPRRKAPMNPNFRRWAKHALYEWDGKTAGETSGSADGEAQLPPNVYNWMSKMMMKTQMKKMKQEMKAAKREMKATKKQQKHGNGNN